MPKPASYEQAAHRIARAHAERQNAYLRESGHPDTDIHSNDPEDYARRHWPEFVWAAEAALTRL